MDPNQAVLLIPIATFWISFNSIAAAVKLAHDQKEKLVRKDFPQEYAAILRADTKYLCIGVVFAIVVFSATLAWLAYVLWEKGKDYHGPSLLVAAEAFFAALTAGMFGLGAIRFFNCFKYEDCIKINEVPRPTTIPAPPEGGTPA